MCSLLLNSRNQRMIYAIKWHNSRFFLSFSRFSTLPIVCCCLSSVCVLFDWLFVCINNKIKLHCFLVTHSFLIKPNALSIHVYSLIGVTIKRISLTFLIYLGMLWSINRHNEQISIWNFHSFIEFRSRFFYFDVNIHVSPLFTIPMDWRSLNLASAAIEFTSWALCCWLCVRVLFLSLVAFSFNSKQY